MPLAPGTRLGPYEIIAPIGAGGMGEVYQARDTRLDRIVAIKVSKEQFSERFELEARAVAALNHPNICTLHDVGPNYLVMEYVEGTPLKGPLPIEKAVDFANQILDALDAAHRKGITHRDLKPDNILVTKQGIKLLDFGLAKQATPLAESDATRVLTTEGQITGTLQYMSPEQLQGKDIDTRSDLFAFGCVLYEMLTGRRAFEGQNAASVVAAILERDPAPLTAAPPLDRVVRRALAKDPDQRFQTARDLKAALAWAMEQPPPSAAAKPSRLWWIGGLAAACLGVLLLLLVFSRWGARPNGELTRFAIYPPEGTKFSALVNATIATPQFALSPDGRAIVFVASGTGAKPMLWARSMDAVGARPIAGTEGATSPFWSPDSRWVGFFAQGKLKKILATGGPAQVIIEGISAARGGAWGPDDTILFSYTYGGVNRVAAAGGPITTVTTLDASRQEGSHGWPQFLPDGRHFLYHSRAGVAAERGVCAGSLDGKTRKFLIRSEWNVVYAAPGYLLYLDGDTLAARAFDAGRLEVSGEPFTIAEHVGGATNAFEAVSVSRIGALAYASAMLHVGRLTWFDRGGKMLESAGPEGDTIDFRLSPDEKRLAVSLADTRVSTPSLWLTDLARGSRSRLTLSQGLEASPVWSPDGTRIVFRAIRRGLVEMYQKSALGGGSEEPLFLLDAQRAVGGAITPIPTDWSPDGQNIVYTIPMAASGYDLWLLPMPGGSPGDTKPAEFSHSPGDEMHGQFSPDGRFVAYSSNESGKFEVYVQTFPRSDRKWPVSTGGGYEPRWRHDGREIYYLSEDRKLMAVPVSAAPAFEPGTPKVLFQTHVPEGVSPQRAHYESSRDGQRFLVNTQNVENAPPSITVVLNWTAGLKK